MIDDNFTVITLCGKTRLISFALSRQEGANVTSVRNLALISLNLILLISLTRDNLTKLSLH